MNTHAEYEWPTEDECARFGHEWDEGAGGGPVRRNGSFDVFDVCVICGATHLVGIDWVL